LGPLRKWIEANGFEDDLASEADPRGGGSGDPGEEAEAPPRAIGPDERRMQLRAYEMWARLLGADELPGIADLVPGEHPSLAPQGVLLDYTDGSANPRIAFLGDALAAECGVAAHDVARISDLPERSLLGRIADHYLKALVSPDPIGFEAEFINQRERTIMYRGILLPFSRDRSTIDFVFSVISWKEIADQQTVEELLLELSQAIGTHDTALQIAGACAGAVPRAGLQALDAQDFAQMAAQGSDVSLVAIGRSSTGERIVLGEVPHTGPLFGAAQSFG